VSGLDTPPALPVRRRVGRAVRHWRQLTGAILVGVGTPVSVVAGWASEDDRGWWLLAAGVCAGIGTLLGLSARGQTTGPAAAITTREPVPGRAAPSGRVWNIPAPVRSFTGRDIQLTALHSRLQSQQRATLVPAAALYGLGGIGKTQLARAYAHRYRNDYQLGWWTPAETPLTATTALAELAIRLGADADLPQPRQVTYAHEALAERDGWLLIFDNATDPATLEPLLPATGNGHVLMTSRTSAWHGLADPIPVDLLPLDAAARLLRERSGDPDQQAAEALGEELGRLPLALEQAAAYASRQRLPLAGYLAVFRERRAELLARGQPLAYQGTVDAAYTLALDQLRQAEPAAVQLLQLCALLAPDEIPVGWLLDKPDLLQGPLADAARDPLRRSEVTGALYQAALLTPDVDDTARLHRLVQTVALHHLPDQDREELVGHVVELLAALFPKQAGEPVAWPVFARLLPHAYALVERAQQQQLASPAMATVLHRMGAYVLQRGLGVTHARDLNEQALTMRQRLYAGDHQDIADSLNNLAVIRHGEADFVGAGDLMEQALAMFQRLHEGDHQDIALGLTNLAEPLRELGDFARARDLNEQALAMLQRLYAGDPDIALVLGNLAESLYGLGDFARARDLFEQALAMRRRLYAGDHPEIASGLHGVAIVVRALGEYTRARELDEEALAMYRRLYAGDQPDIARSLNNLAEDLYELEEYTRAQELDEQALVMYRRLYAGDHPDIARSLNNLAEDLRGLGDYARAHQLHEQALAMYQRVYAHDHPRIATTLNNLAEDLRGLGDYTRAQQLDEQALAMRQRLYKGDHPDIAASLNNLANDMRELGNYPRARDLEEQALTMRQQLAERDVPPS
jgi:tetratricopeptide (TPR) repeat protein